VTGWDNAPFVDPYIDPSSGILRNLVGARTWDDLHRAEAALVTQRTVELAGRYPLHPGGGLDELCGIHRQLFQDVYDWAGKTRTVDINKPGGEPFLPWSRIGTGTRFVFEALAQDGDLRGLDRSAFVERLAFHYDALNYAHPFREGNGRTQRVFWSRIARSAGWDLDWRLASGQQNDAASRAGAEGSDLRPLRELFDRITPAAPQRTTGRAVIDPSRLGVGQPPQAARPRKRPPGAGRPPQSGG
jgi:cell filamentation protein